MAQGDERKPPRRVLGRALPPPKREPAVNPASTQGPLSGEELLAFRIAVLVFRQVWRGFTNLLYAAVLGAITGGAAWLGGHFKWPWSGNP